MGGYAYNSPYNRLYNTHTQIAFAGKVTGVQRTVPMSGMAEGVTLLVKDKKGGTAVVDLGPAWYVDHQVTKIHVKDNVEVIGSKVMVDGRGVILAKLVKKTSNKQVLALRRINGYPYWDVSQPVAGVNWGRDPNATDPNVTEITGTVEGITSFGNGPNITSGMVLRTENGNLTIDLGPSWFVQPQGYAFVNPGSNLVVFTGGTYNLSPNGTPVPAYYVRYNNQIYPLRNPANGMGIWQGWQPNP